MTDEMPGYVSQAKRWTEATKLVAAGCWHGIRCPQNSDDDVLIEKRLWRLRTTTAREHLIAI